MTEPLSTEVERLHEAARVATTASDPRAIAWCEAALALDPMHAATLELLGTWRIRQERWGDAIALLDAARKSGRDSATLLNQLATAWYRLGNLRMAVNALTTALKLEPNDVDSHLNVASLLLVVHQLGPARVHAERAIALSPRRYEALLGMGLLERAADRSGAALSWFEKAEGTAPERVDAPMAIGAAYQEMGKPAKAIAAFERALRWNPTHADLLSNSLFTTNFLLEWDPQAALDAHGRYELAIRVPVHGVSTGGTVGIVSTRGAVGPASTTGTALAVDGDSPIRIGYVSGDFRHHAVARFLLPVLRHHDRQRFHVTGYYTGRTVDATTREMAGLCGAFHQVAGLNDQRLLEKVAADSIDILFDLSGHSSGNRLPVFAARAAPIQISWLGYLGSTGVSAMDFRITDVIADPTGDSDARHSEKLIRLPQTMWTYEPYAQAPDVTSLPFRRNGYITFGTLSNPAKLSDLALQTWARVMRELPGARLRIMGRDDDAVRDRIMRPFRDAGIDVERVTVLARMPIQGYLEAYGDIDIALDPFPFCGGTTVCDALWQGVPVLAVNSPRPFGSSASTILHQVGLDNWWANSSESLVALAVEKASVDSMNALETLRNGMRRRMQASPLLDGAGFTRYLEEVLTRLATQD